MLALYHCFLLALALFGSNVSAAPAAISRRQNPVTVESQQTIDTASGKMLETCTITLTPVTGADGTVEMQEVTSCVTTPLDATSVAATSSSTAAAATSTDAAASSAAATTAAASSSAAAASSTDTTAATSTSAAAVSSAAVSSSDAASSTDTTAASSTSAAAAASGTPIVGTFSSIPISAISSGLATSTAAAGASASSVAGAAAATSAADTAPSASSAADNAAASASASAFVVPGKSLQVLPIGLGVFGGISVIALIVVGLVTYERTKYRKAFRQKKLAEQGAAMGYGGMRGVA